MNVCYFEIWKKAHTHLCLLLLLSQQHSHVFSEMFVFPQNFKAKRTWTFTSTSNFLKTQVHLPLICSGHLIRVKHLTRQQLPSPSCQKPWLISTKNETGWKMLSGYSFTFLKYYFIAKEIKTLSLFHLS